MHCKKTLFIVGALCTLQLLAIHNTMGQDTLSKQKDSLLVKNEKEAAYTNFLYVSGFASNTLNDYFYDNYYKTGKGIQLGVPLYSQDRYTIRFNLAYSSFKFQKSEYLKTDTLLEGENISGTPLQTVTFLPDIIIHPFPKYLVSPYVNVGIGMMMGSNQPTITKTRANLQPISTERAFGTRYFAQMGLGGIVQALPYCSVFAGLSYNIEFLRSKQPEDIFYKFKTADNSFKYLYFTLGVQMKLRKK